MSTLWVIRHGQASFFEADYDRLSDVGHEQARRLGEYFARQGVEFDRVYCGPRQRHRDTALRIGEALAAAGRRWPEPTVLPGLDEYEAEAVLKLALPKLIDEHEEVRRLHADLEAAESRRDKLRMFQRVYEVVIKLWATGQLELGPLEQDQVESWPQFELRAQAAYDAITSSAGGGERVAAITSGGPVGVAMARALATDLDATLHAAWMIRNAAYCEFVFSGQRFTLSSYNSFPHLTEPGLLTYR